MGGRAAEELNLGSEQITSGAADDLKKATATAMYMVRQLGMSEKLGIRFYDPRSTSDATNELIESEVRRLLSESYERAKSILKQHADAHKRLTEALLEYETLDADDLKCVIEGRAPKCAAVVAAAAAEAKSITKLNPSSVHTNILEAAPQFQ